MAASTNLKIIRLISNGGVFSSSSHRDKNIYKIVNLQAEKLIEFCFFRFALKTVIIIITVHLPRAALETHSLSFSTAILDVLAERSSSGVF